MSLQIRSVTTYSEKRAGKAPPWIILLACCNLFFFFYVLTGSLDSNLSFVMDNIERYRFAERGGAT